MSNKPLLYKYTGLLFIWTYLIQILVYWYSGRQTKVTNFSQIRCPTFLAPATLTTFHGPVGSANTLYTLFR